MRRFSVIMYGTDVNYPGRIGKKPIHSATEHKNLQVVNLILHHGGEIDAQDSNGRSPLHRACNSLSTVSQVQSNISERSDYNEDSTTIVHADTWSKDDHEYTRVIELLVASGADIHVKDIYGWDAIRSAAHGGHEHIVKLLLDHGAEFQKSSMKIDSPVLLAAAQGHEAIFKLLIARGVNLNATNKIGWTAVHCAVWKGMVNILSYLSKAGIDIDVTDAQGNTALILAARKNRLACLKKLLYLGANVNIASNHGLTTLSYATQHKNLEMLKVLLPLVTDINTQAFDGETALSVTIYKCSEKDEKVALPAIKLLLDGGAEIAPIALGPHSVLVEPKERMAGYAVDSLIPAWDLNLQAIVRVILKALAKCELGSEYKRALRLLATDDKDGLREWFDERKLKATSSRPKISALIKAVYERADADFEARRKKGLLTMIWYEKGDGPHPYHVG